MLIKLTHPEPNYEFWIDYTEIIVLERYNRPDSLLIKMDEKPSVTALVLRNGKILSCKETPAQIQGIIAQAKATPTV